MKLRGGPYRVGLLLGILIVALGCASPTPPLGNRAIVTGPSQAQSVASSPRFSTGGPDADKYGAAEGYPVKAISRLPFFVGSFSHYDQLLEGRTIRQVAAIWDPGTPSHTPALKAVETASRSLGLRLQALGVRSVAEVDGAFSAAARERAGAVLVLSTPLYMGAAKQLAELGLARKLPTMFGPREHVEAGGLVSYSPDRADLYRRAAGYVDKILKGANPAELPVQQATQFELVVNLRTAKALGLALPPAVLVRATQIIE